MKFAASILAMYFSLMGLLPQSDFCELRKIPAMYEHYLEHREADGDSFLEFFYEDFLSDVGDQENHHGKQPTEEMPFQNHSSQSHCCNFIPLSLNSYEILRSQNEVEKGSSTYSFNYSFLYLDSIFQPPRV